ncbi:HNH endonuclease [Pseudoalteromonas pernae]|uniref:HNH endonuclease n=1 Tax=Pseudoalteromonas pernae TaxID=3118054 RepID=UPI0032426E32
MGTRRTSDLSAKPQAEAWLIKHPSTHKLVTQIIDYLEGYRVEGCEYGWYNNKNNPVFKFGGNSAEGRLSIRCLVNGCRVIIPLPESRLPKHLQGTGSVKKGEYQTPIEFHNDSDNSDSLKLMVKFIKTNLLDALKYKELQIDRDDGYLSVMQDETLDATARKALIDARVGQGKFRSDLINYWCKCAVTGCDFKPLLKASHIKPWKVANNYERLDKYNGLLLCANLDELFDKGYISFNDDGSIIISKNLPIAVRKLLGIPRSIKINLDKKHSQYLAYHRKEILL